MKADIAIIFLQFIYDTIHFKNSFFPSSISVWNNLDCKIKNSGSLSIFKKNLLNLTWPCTNSIFNIHNPNGIKLLTRLCLGLSHLCDHKFRHCFQDILNPLSDCGNDGETTTHFFLHCPNFHTPRQTLLSNIRNINDQILSCGEDQLIQAFLYGNPNCNLTVYRFILNTTIEYIILTEQLKCPLSNQQLTRNATRCNSRDDLRRLSFRKFQCFWRHIYIPVEHLW